MKSEVNLKSFKMESPKNSLPYSTFSQMGEDLGDFIERSLEKKVPMREWKRFGAGIDPKKGLRHDVNVGVSDASFKEEHEKALNGNITPWCETFGCYNCGSCD